MNLSELSTKDLCAQYVDAENAITAVRVLAQSTQAAILDVLAVRNPSASCAFLRAVAMGEAVKPKDFFLDKEEKAEKPEKPKEQEKQKEQPTKPDGLRAAK